MRYSALFTAVLCRLFERAGVSHRFDWFLLLPLISGICDLYENQVQQVFLSAADFSTIVDPLPLLSTLASNTKWLLASVYLLVTVLLFLRVSFRREAACG